jgi:hypothetical protein
LKRATTISVLCLLFASAAHAQEQGFEDSRLEFRVGGQAFTQFTTRVRIDSETLGIGTEVELEDELAVEDSTGVGRLDGVLRFGRRHALAMSYYDITREGTRSIVRDIRVGDSVFPINTAVTTEFEQEIIKAAYRFRFINKDRANLSGSFGLHTMRFSSALRGANGTISEENETDAPLPVIGIQGAYKLGGKWSLNGSLEWFDITSGDLQGTFTDSIVAVEHQTFENFGFGFGYDRLALRFEAGSEDLRGRLDVKFDAAMIYFNGRFGSVGR